MVAFMKQNTYRNGKPLYSDTKIRWQPFRGKQFVIDHLLEVKTGKAAFFGARRVHQTRRDIEAYGTKTRVRLSTDFDVLNAARLMRSRVVVVVASVPLDPLLHRQLVIVVVCPRRSVSSSRLHPEIQKVI